MFDFSVEHRVAERLDAELTVEAGLNDAGVAFLDASPQLQRINLDDGGDRCARTDVFADLHQALRNDAADRRADDGVVQLLDGEIVGGATILEKRLLSTRRVDAD